MDPRSAGRRDLAVLAVTIVGLSRFADGPLLWLVAGLLLVALLLGSLQVLGEGEPRGVPIESLILPAVAGMAAVGAIRLVPIGLALAPVLFLAGVLVERTLALEDRLEDAAAPPRAEDRTRVVTLVLVVAFAAFTGVAAMVPGGLVAPADGVEPGAALGGESLAVLVLGDALVAFLLGYRVSALRLTALRDVAWSALTYAIVMAIAAGALRGLALPLLLGPALLTLVFFLWDALHGTAPARRRDPRWLWEFALLVVLGVLIVALNVRLAD
jgi:hypothetical protein